MAKMLSTIAAKIPGVAADQPLRQRRHGGHDEEAKPQAIKHQSNPQKMRE
jgi:hypothetical protein